MSTKNLLSGKEQGPRRPAPLPNSRILALVLIGLLAALVTYVILGSDSRNDQRDLNDIAQSVLTEYTIPLSSAAASTQVLCQYTTPNDVGNAKCGAYVETLRAHTLLLVPRLAELTALRAASLGTNAAPRNPLDDFIDFLTSIHENDEQIIQAWDARDDAAWSQAWAARKAIPKPDFSQYATPSAAN